MEKIINISFYDKNYNISETSLSSASDKLKSHLSTVMNGSGDTVDFDGVSYNIDSSKLTTAKNDFISHLETIVGSGSSIIVDGVKYGVDSMKISDAISDIQEVLGRLGGNDDSCIVTNEYGFYYDTKYSCYNFDSSNGYPQGEIAFYFKEDQTCDMYVNNGFLQTFSVIYSDKTIDVLSIGVTLSVISEKKMIIPNFAAIKLGDSIIIDEYYTYKFASSYYTNYEYCYWMVYVNDKTLSNYGLLRNKIDGYPLCLSQTFLYCTNLITAPVIPDGVLDMGGTFNGCASLTTAPEIPDGVINMSYTFCDCTSLITAPVIPDSVEDISGTFYGCTSLTGSIEINCYPYMYERCFDGTEKPITITGSCSTETKAALAATANNNNVAY